MAATAVGARERYDVHARPFEAAIRLARLAAVMPSYAEFDGVPISASHAVLTDGGPYAVASVIDKLPAAVTAYYAGPHHGPAIADALFGLTNPGGKLPFTLPRHVGQVPIHHAQSGSSRSPCR